MQSTAVHQRIVRNFRNLPPRRHKWTDIEPLPKKTVVEKTKELLRLDVATAARSIGAVVARNASFLLGEETLQDRIPASKLSNRVGTHALLILREAWQAGILVRMWRTDIYTVHIDFGNGHVVELGITLHNVADTNNETRGSITAKPAKDFDPDALDFFEPVQSIPFAEEPRVLSASLRRVRKEGV
jgi:hypothetical protein